MDIFSELEPIINLPEPFENPNISGEKPPTLVSTSTDKSSFTRVIFPKNPKKYGGSITESTYGALFSCQMNNEKHSVFFKNKDKAVEYRKNFSNLHGLTKNVIYDYNTHLEMNVGDTLVMLDREDLPKLDAWVWKYRYTVEATTEQKGIFQKVKLGNYLVNAPNHFILTHLNGNRFDFRKSNLAFRIPSNKSRKKGVIPRPLHLDSQNPVIFKRKSTQRWKKFR